MRERFDLAPLAGGLLKPFAQWDVEIPGVTGLRSAISEEALKLTHVKAAQRSKGLHLAQERRQLLCCRPVTVKQGRQGGLQGGGGGGGGAGKSNHRRVSNVMPRNSNHCEGLRSDFHSVREKPKLRHRCRTC